eukprot:CAMPEP_0168407410 /NCGR_PEP_ID=MMETSP0228-20121227/26147_1 /TAXON_ID=133427 /ORGANISM="Protoceratium reticulatum, Strain CCCM 535 (=CCMP 1889)" /LENGTH=369 /DNA_ID=CAMNT_0008421077 /DNA_START=76 /DNA_END=1182 /DNA_ORIENTATION=+
MTQADWRCSSDAIARGTVTTKKPSHSAGALSSSSAARYWHEKMRFPASQAVFDGAQRGDVRHVVNALKASGDPNCIASSGCSALVLAVGGGFRELVGVLLQAHADPNCDFAGATPLMAAAAAGHSEVARMLVNCGAKSTPADAESGRTALHRASQRGHAEVARLLLQSGALVDADDKQGCTPLALAAEAGHGEVVRILLCAGATMSTADSEGESAVAKCVANGHEACLECLLKAGAPINAVNRNTGECALLTAARAGNESTCRRLLQFQANANLASQRRETPLMLAAQGGHAKIVHMLLLAGADTTLQDIRGHTALMWAAAGGSAAVVSVLLDFGASPSFASPVDGSTPLTMAALSGHTEAPGAWERLE